MDFKYGVSDLRFSSRGQSEGSSIRRQREMLTSYYEREGVEEVDSYEDAAVSAFKGDNVSGTIAKILNRAANKDYPEGTLLVIESLDRMSREEIPNALDTFMKILKSGLSICTLSDNERIYRAGKVNMTDIIISLTIMSRAHEESLIKSKRVIAAYDIRVAEAREGKRLVNPIVPSWLKVVDGKAELVDERVEQLLWIYETFVSENIGAEALKNRINKENKWKPWKAKNSTNKSGLWSKSYVHKLLSNTSVIGWYQPRKTIDGKKVDFGEVIKDYFPQAISEDLFWEAQSKFRKNKQFLNGRKNIEKFGNLFRGFVKCYGCGGNMHYTNKGKHQYFMCSHSCGEKSVRYDIVEPLVMRLAPLINSDQVRRNNILIEKKNDVVNAQVALVQESLNNLSNQYIATRSKTILDIIQREEAEVRRLESTIEPLIQQDSKFEDKLALAEEYFNSKEDLGWRKSMVNLFPSVIERAAIKVTGNSVLATIETKDGKMHSGIARYYYGRNFEIRVIGKDEANTLIVEKGVPRIKKSVRLDFSKEEESLRKAVDQYKARLEEQALGRNEYE